MAYVQSPSPGRLECVNIQTLIMPMKMSPLDVLQTIIINLSVHCICIFVYEINYEINSFKRLCYKLAVLKHYLNAF